MCLVAKKGALGIYVLNDGQNTFLIKPVNVLENIPKNVNGIAVYDIQQGTSNVVLGLDEYIYYLRKLKNKNRLLFSFISSDFGIWVKSDDNYIDKQYILGVATIDNKTKFMTYKQYMNYESNDDDSTSFFLNTSWEPIKSENGYFKIQNCLEWTIERALAVSYFVDVTCINSVMPGIINAEDIAKKFKGRNIAHKASSRFMSQYKKNYYDDTIKKLGYVIMFVD